MARWSNQTCFYEREPLTGHDYVNNANNGVMPQSARLPANCLTWVEVMAGPRLERSAYELIRFSKHWKEHSAAVLRFLWKYQNLC